MALTGGLVFAALSAALSSFLFGYNVGVISAPRAVVGNWVRSVQCRRNGGVPEDQSSNNSINNTADLWCKYYEESDMSTVMFDENGHLKMLWTLISSLFCAGALISAGLNLFHF